MDKLAAGITLPLAIEEAAFSDSFLYAGASLSCVKVKVGVSVSRQKRGLFLMRVLP